ncbi:hypothetical protein ABPG75_010767 [Micractinium tetrahymenae]
MLRARLTPCRQSRGMPSSSPFGDRLLWLPMSSVPHWSPPLPSPPRPALPCPACSKISCVEVLESLDGMVGAYEVADEMASAIQGKKVELQEAADDYQRILAELQELATAAGLPSGGSAAGGGAAAGAEAGEGAGVADLE